MNRTFYFYLNQNLPGSARSRDNASGWELYPFPLGEVGAVLLSGATAASRIESASDSVWIICSSLILKVPMSEKLQAFDAS